jgi:steroid 5-alpha reductase family enzyme
MSASATRVLVNLLVVGLGALFAWAAADGGQRLGPLPLIAWGVIAAFLIQWAVFVPSSLKQTERFFDLTGSLTYIAVTLGLALLSDADPRTWLLTAMVLAWAVRLGTFLFRRVWKDGGDSRFAERKKDPLVFGTVWNIQGLWVTTTALAAWTAITSAERAPLGWLALLGVAVWLLGFVVEVVADAQKSRFKADPANNGEFIDEGLWSRSRHPNYFGEITLWIGVLLVAAPALSGWQWIALVSPLFVTVLLTRVSGVPLQERQAEERWGDRADYRAYRERTPVLIPRLTASKETA